MKNLIITLLILTVSMAVSCNSKTAETNKTVGSGNANSVLLKNAKPVESKIPAEELVLNKKETKTYKRLLKSPKVSYLRNVLDKYRAGEKLNADADIEKENRNALKDIDKEAIAGKFIVFSETKNPMGGTNIELMFQGQPDKVHNAWIYGENKDSFTLRSFTAASYYTQQDVKNIQIRYKRFLKDPEYAR